MQKAFQIGFIAAIYLVFGCGRRVVETERVDIPPLASISSAEFSGTDFDKSHENFIPAFKLLPSDTKVVYDLLFPRTIETQPAKWTVFGSIRFTTNSGEDVISSLYITTADSTEKRRIICNSTRSNERGEYYRCGLLDDMRRALKDAKLHRDESVNEN